MKRKILKASHYAKIMNTVRAYEGERIEVKCARITETGEPITDGAPAIYTEKKDGVLPQYDIRADKWEIAQNAMDKANAARIAKGQQLENPEKPDKQTAKAAEDKKPPSQTSDATPK